MNDEFGVQNAESKAFAPHVKEFVGIREVKVAIVGLVFADLSAVQVSAHASRPHFHLRSMPNAILHRAVHGSGIVSKPSRSDPPEAARAIRPAQRPAEGAA